MFSTKKESNVLQNERRQFDSERILSTTLLAMVAEATLSNHVIDLGSYLFMFFLE